MRQCWNKIFFIGLLLAAVSAPLLAEEPVQNASLEGEARLAGKMPGGGDVKIVEYTGPCGRKTPSSTIHLWKSRVMDVTLWLTKADGNMNVDTENVISQLGDVDIKGERCEFNPSLVVARPGAIVKVTNEDPLTQWLIVDEKGSRKRQVMLEQGGPSLEFEVREDREIYLLSGFHPWMEAWIRPVPNLVSTTHTTWDGRFYFGDIPPGDYILHAWHPSLGESSMAITVIPGDDMSVDVTFSMPEKRVPVIEASMLEELFRTDSIEKDNNPFKIKK